jgi:cyclic beta-1,2-glucan synthetase
MTSFAPAASVVRRTCLLSNGDYSVMLSDGGSGFSRWRDMAVTRWREDMTREPWGTCLLVRDERSGSVWSTTRQPYGTDSCDVTTFGAGHAEFSRRVGLMESTLEVAVAHDGDIELRRLTLRNQDDVPRELSLTSYAELVLGPAGTDDSHPAFSKMFVQTEWNAQHRALLATRRRRSRSEPEIWVSSALRCVDASIGTPVEYETDRAQFLGRCRTLRNAQAMQPGARLAQGIGCVLDPILSLRRHFALAPGASIQFLLWTRVASSREDALDLPPQPHNAAAAAQLFARAERFAVTEQARLDIDEGQSARYARWLSALLVSDARCRGRPEIVALGRGGPPTLWPLGISCDRPIMLLRLGGAHDLRMAYDVLLAQTLWRSKRFAVDVVLLNAAEGPAGDRLQRALIALADAQKDKDKATTESPPAKAELFALREAELSEDVRNGLHTVARIVLDSASPTSETDALDAAPSTPMPAICASRPVSATGIFSPEVLEFENGLGGFCRDGQAYHVRLTGERVTPAPWINVIANPSFGFFVSAEGGGYAWAANSQQNALTPWPNDPVSDTPHDVIYLRDCDSGALWSTTALPIRVRDATYSVTHEKGSSTFTTDAHGIEVELTMGVATTDPVKISRLRISNRSARTRRLSVTGYVEWALGANGSVSAPFIVTARDSRTGALFARNAWRPDFAEDVAFFDMAGLQQSMCGDRGAFLGPSGAVDRPAALGRDDRLPDRLGAGLDPCGALQARIDLPAATEIELVFLLGSAASEGQAQRLIEKYRAAQPAEVLAAARAQWDRLLGAVQVRTPNRAMDILLNDWLLYQVLSCRVWGRTAYYQASGAYGFRDQLQDVMALCVSRPDVAREHLMRAAGRQFAEGDVQHWWLPPSGRGVRTKISDDRVWLAYVAAHYVGVSGDATVFDELSPILDGPPIPAGATDAFFQPTPTSLSISVYEHCARALDCSLTRGQHGLPLMGTGDWNDGMNAVGEEGRGESAWLGWFLIATLCAFIPYAEQRGETERVERWRAYGKDMRAALESAWDGQWYRRGYYDDGAPLGSAENTECRIDTIAQSWSVMAGSADPQHQAEAMASVDRLLIDRQNRIACLFAPPFDQNSDENPGYIKGYPPGVRENGGQYTHGAIWSIFAWAILGEGDRAAALFDLLNPIHHSDTPEGIARYRVEPYVSCADVYSEAPWIGRGGWTWYSGSAAWLYRAGLEALLGFQLRGNQLRIDPCIPEEWPGFELTYQHRNAAQGATRYEIRVENPHHVSRGVRRVELDGDVMADGTVTLSNDGRAHTVRIVLS